MLSEDQIARLADWISRRRDTHVVKEENRAGNFKKSAVSYLKKKSKGKKHKIQIENYIKNCEDQAYLFDEKKAIKDIIYSMCIDKESVCIEVGVRLGENAAQICLNNPKKLYLVDPWLVSSTYPHHYGNEGFYRKVKKLFRGIPSVKILRETSEKASKEFKSKSVDFAYIDAGHTYDDVKLDLSIWSKKIKVGGYICGDDYFGVENPDWRVKWDSPRGEYGVIRAVDEFLENNPGFNLVYFDEEQTFPLPGGHFLIQRKR